MASASEGRSFEKSSSNPGEPASGADDNVVVQRVHRLVVVAEVGVAGRRQNRPRPHAHMAEGRGARGALRLVGEEPLLVERERRQIRRIRFRLGDGHLRDGTSVGRRCGDIGLRRDRHRLAGGSGVELACEVEREVGAAAEHIDHLRRGDGEQPQVGERVRGQRNRLVEQHLLPGNVAGPEAALPLGPSPFRIRGGERRAAEHDDELVAHDEALPAPKRATVAFEEQLERFDAGNYHGEQGLRTILMLWGGPERPGPPRSLHLNYRRTIASGSPDPGASRPPP